MFACSKLEQLTLLFVNHIIMSGGKLYFIIWFFLFSILKGVRLYRKIWIAVFSFYVCFHFFLKKSGFKIS